MSTPTPDDHIRAAARLLSQGCDWSLFLSGLSRETRAELLKHLAAEALAPEVHAYVERLDARRLEVARRAIWEHRRKGGKKRRRRRGRQEPLYDVPNPEDVPPADGGGLVGLYDAPAHGGGDFLSRIIRQLAPAAAMLGAQAMLGRLAGGGGLVTRTREDYERGMPCGEACGKTIKLGDVTIKSMTCMECGAEVCGDCQSKHGAKHTAARTA